MSCTASNDLCRLCQQHPGAYNVYVPDPVHSATSPAARIMWVTQLQVIDGDGLPTEICRQCWIQLNAAYSFIERCLSTDKALRTQSMHETPTKAESMLEVNIEEDEDEYEDTRDYDSYNAANSNLAQPCPSEIGTIIKVEQDDSMPYDSMQNDPAVFVCSICEGSFERKRAYILHMQLHAAEISAPVFQPPKTEEVPLLKCDLCLKTFTYASHLKRHVRKHTGDYPYKCTLCEKAFYRQDHLTKHFRSHTGERPFQCTLCGRSFTRRDHLATHVKVHVRVKPFGCALCSQSFFKQGGLVRHLKNHPPVSGTLG